MKKHSINTVDNKKIQRFIDAHLSAEEIVEKRVFLVRHGECEEEQVGYDINKQKNPKSKLTDKGQEQIEETASYLFDILEDPKNKLVIEHNASNSIRIEESTNIIVDKIGGYSQKLDDIGLDSLPPYVEDDQMQAKLKGGAKHVEYYDGLKLRLQNEYKEQIKYILLSVHKSAISNLENLFISKKMGFVTEYDYDHGEIREWDYTQEGKFINKYEKKDILHINKGNRVGVVGILENDEIITQEVKLLKGNKNDKIHIKDMEIINLQNFINACFKKHPELYEKYLASENEDLRVFCLVNLFRELEESGYLYNAYQNDIKTREGFMQSRIREVYLNDEIEFSIREKEIFLLKIKEIQFGFGNRLWELVIEYFITKKESRNVKTSEIFDKLELNDFHDRLKNKREIYQNAVDVEKRSLDKQIKLQKGGIFERQIYSIEKNNKSKTEEKNKKTEEKYKKKKIDIKQHLSENKHNHYVLSSHVGTGKSIWLAELVKKEIINDYTNIKYFEGKHFDCMEKINDIGIREYIEGEIGSYDLEKKMGIIKGKNICFKLENDFDKKFPEGSSIEAIIKGYYDTDLEDRIRKIEEAWISYYYDNSGKMIRSDTDDDIDNYCYNPILCIDGIDEIPDNKVKEKLKNIIKKLSHKVIITSRLSEYNDKENDGFITLSMDPINKDTFIDSRVQDLETRKMIKEKIHQSGLVGEIEGNPLLLNFICILANEEEKFQDIGIKKLEQIENKADLYENIVKLVLYTHQKEIHGDCFIKNNILDGLNEYMGVAGDFAYNQYIDTYKLPLEKIKIRSSDVNNMNILFRLEEKGNYSFIHKSFEEFFLARYLADQNDGDQEIYKVINMAAGEQNRNERKKFRPIVDFYSEKLINNSDVEKLQKFLGEECILKDDDAFGYNFLLGLETITKFKGNLIDQEIIDKYIKKITDMGMYEFLNASDIIESILEIKKYVHPIIDAIIEKIEGPLYRSLQNDDVIIKLIQGKKISFLLSNKKIKDFFNERLEKGLIFMALREQLIDNKELKYNKKIIEFMEERRDDLSKKNKFLGVREISNRLKELLEKNNEDEKELRNEETKARRKMKCYKPIIENGVKKYIEITAKDLANDHLKEKNFRGAEIVYTMIGDGDTKSMKIIKEGADEIFEAGGFEEAGRLYEKILGKGYRVNIENMEKCISELMVMNNSYLVGSMYKTIVSNGNAIIFENIKKNTDILLEKGEFDIVLSIYEELIENGNPRGIKIFKEGFNKIFKEGFKEGFKENKHYLIYSIGELYGKLAKKGDKMVFENIKKCADRLLELGGYFGLVSSLYQILAEIGDEESTRIAKEGIDSIWGSEELYHEVGGVYEKLAGNGNPKATTIAIEGIDKLFKKIEIQRNNESQDDILLKREKHILKMIGKISIQLAKNGDKNIVEYAKKNLELLFHKGYCFFVDVKIF